MSTTDFTMSQYGYPPAMREGFVAVCRAIRTYFTAKWMGAHNAALQTYLKELHETQDFTGCLIGLHDIDIETINQIIEENETN